tara:strand:- start:124 stop:339 length:216 start_codon:yes stop_codon:yes gene_type:complete
MIKKRLWEENMHRVKIGDLIQLNGDDGVVYYGTVLHKGKHGINVLYLDDGHIQWYLYGELRNERMFILEAK